MQNSAHFMQKSLLYSWLSTCHKQFSALPSKWWSHVMVLLCRVHEPTVVLLSCFISYSMLIYLITLLITSLLVFFIYMLAHVTWQEQCIVQLVWCSKMTPFCLASHFLLPVPLDFYEAIRHPQDDQRVERFSFSADAELALGSHTVDEM